MGISGVDFFGPGSTLSAGAGPGELQRASGVAADTGISASMLFVGVLAVLIAVRVLYETASKG